MPDRRRPTPSSGTTGGRGTSTRPSVEELAAGVADGDRVLLAQAITLVESNHPEHQKRAQRLLHEILPASGRSHRVGVSGVPGVGKSTFIEALGRRLLEAGHRVAVLAVDPSSSISRGSILGDKTRMADLASDERAFIRPSPSGGSLGGVARKTRESVLLTEAAGFDVILVETVGVGQSETMVAEMVDTFLVLKLAGAGDGLQGIKRGILELADLIAINKADGDNRRRAERARAEFERALEILKPPRPDRWMPRVLSCSAIDGSGIQDVWATIEEHRRFHEKSGSFAARRREQLIRWMWSLVEEGLKQSLRSHSEIATLIPQIERQILAGELPPTAAARRILELFTSHTSSSTPV